MNDLNGVPTGPQINKVGIRVQPGVITQTSTPIVLMLIGNTPYQLPASLAMQVGSDLCSAANMASLQAGMREFFISEGHFTLENCDYLLTKLNEWLEARNANREGDSADIEGAPEHNI